MLGVIGGDGNTVACIAGGLAEALYGLPSDIVAQAARRLDPDLNRAVAAFHARFGGAAVATANGGLER